MWNHFSKAAFMPFQSRQEYTRLAIIRTATTPHCHGAGLASLSNRSKPYRFRAIRTMLQPTRPQTAQVVPQCEMFCQPVQDCTCARYKSGSILKARTTSKPGPAKASMAKSQLHPSGQLLYGHIPLDSFSRTASISSSLRPIFRRYSLASSARSVPSAVKLGNSKTSRSS